MPAYSGGRAKRRKEIKEMSEKDMQAEIERTEVAMNERVKPATRRGQELSMGKLPPITLVLGLVGMLGGPVEAFTAYDCSNRSNIVYSYSLLETDACQFWTRRGNSRQPCSRKLYRLSRIKPYQYQAPGH